MTDETPAVQATPETPTAAPEPSAASIPPLASVSPPAAPWSASQFPSFLSGAPAPATSGLAIASLVLSLVGLLFGWICCMPLFSILAVVFGHISYAQITGKPYRYSGRGLAIAGLIIGYIGMVVSVIVGIAVGVLSMLAGLAENNLR